jgi:hypothetical protein
MSADGALEPDAAGTGAAAAGAPTAAPGTAGAGCEDMPNCLFVRSDDLKVGIKACSRLVEALPKSKGTRQNGTHTSCHA